MHKQLLIVMLICLKGADYIICTAVDKKGFSLAPERLVR